MQTLKIVFTKRAVIGSYLIRAITWSEWSHVEILTPEGTLLGANAFKGVTETPLEKRLKHSTAAQYVEVQTDRAEEILSWARSQLGKPYDYIGLISFLAKRDLTEKGKYFCSEYVASAFEAVGEPLFRVGSTFRVSPQSIWSLPFPSTALK